MLFTLINILLAIANFIILGILIRRLNTIKTSHTARSSVRWLRLRHFLTDVRLLKPQASANDKTQLKLPLSLQGQVTKLTPITNLEIIEERRSDTIDKVLLDKLKETNFSSEDQKEITSDSEKWLSSHIWNVVRASVRGAGHIKNDIPCQDYNNYKFFGGKNIIAAIADGVGSASRADEGAKFAVDTFLSLTKNMLDERLPCSEKEWIDVAIVGFQQARRALETQAQNNALALEDYATTLITIILTDDWLVIGHIGDGGAVVLFENNELVTISPPQRGEYANYVLPLTKSDALEVAKFSATNGKVQAVALFTDGIQHLALNNGDDSPHPPFFTAIFKELSSIKDCEKASEQLNEYLASERINSKTDDDKTLLLIGRKNI